MPLEPQAHQMDVQRVVKMGLDHLSSSAVVEPRKELIRRVIAAHDVPGELEARVLANVAGGAGHVAIKYSLRNGAERLILRHDL